MKSPGHDMTIPVGCKCLLETSGSDDRFHHPKLLNLLAVRSGAPKRPSTNIMEGPLITTHSHEALFTCLAENYAMSVPTGNIRLNCP